MVNDNRACFIGAGIFLLIATWFLLCALSPKLRRRYGGWIKGTNLRLSAIGNTAAAIICFSWASLLSAIGLGYESVVQYAFWPMFGVTVLTAVLSLFDQGEPSAQ